MTIRIKICGITNPEDGARAAELGCDAVGLNFYARSPRCISPSTAQRILQGLPPFVEPVGVFVDADWRDIALTAQALCGLKCIQRYGPVPEEPPPGNLRFIPAFPVRDVESLLVIATYLDRCRESGQLPTAILVDAHVPGQHGGTGKQLPWQLLADFDPGVPLVLAGGLTAENVAEAIHTVHPWAVDVASGVESEPGHKDVEKMKRFIESARTAAQR